MPSGDCLAGYYCNNASEEAYPVNKSYGVPVDLIVKQLVINLQLAQLELISQNTTRTALSDCLACTPSKYCDQTGMSDVVRDCLQGNAHFLTLII